MLSKAWPDFFKTPTPVKKALTSVTLIKRAGCNQTSRSSSPTSSSPVSTMFFKEQMKKRKKKQRKRKHGKHFMNIKWFINCAQWTLVFCRIYNTNMGDLWYVSSLTLNSTPRPLLQTTNHWGCKQPVSRRYDITLTIQQFRLWCQCYMTYIFNTMIPFHLNKYKAILDVF